MATLFSSKQVFNSTKQVYKKSSLNKSYSRKSVFLFFASNTSYIPLRANSRSYQSFLFPFSSIIFLSSSKCFFINKGSVT